MKKSNTLRIGIVGAGFTGTALAAHLHSLSSQPLDITLFEKRGVFGLGQAYSTPYLHHLLNVRSKDMSAFEHIPTHFTDWLIKNQKDVRFLNQNLPLSDQFVPRAYYGEYLQALLQEMQFSKKNALRLEAGEIIAIEKQNSAYFLKMNGDKQFTFDKIIFAIGNNLPASFAFPITSDIQCLQDPWNFTSPSQIPSSDPVMIVGTGLSMIDAVLTLHHQGHQGKIYGLSRRGLLPLKHTDLLAVKEIDKQALQPNLLSLWQYLRKISKEAESQQQDWRPIINGFRKVFPAIWMRAAAKEKKRFLRHALTYWNIHRHRVPDDVAELLEMLVKKDQLEVFAGRIVQAKDQYVWFVERGKPHVIEREVKWLINCMGPSSQMQPNKQPLVKSLLDNHLASLDELKLGFEINEHFALINAEGSASNALYTLGSPAKGINWTCTSVPEIRQQCASLARHILDIQLA